MITEGCSAKGATSYSEIYSDARAQKANMLGLLEAAQSRAQRAKASIDSDALAQKARAARLELSEAAKPRVQQAKASIYSNI